MLDSDAFTKRIVASLNEFLDRWVMCSQWAGVWEYSTRALERFASSLATTSNDLGKSSTADEAVRVLREALQSLVASCEENALAHVHSASVITRERFGGYYSLLWIWHRLDADRWSMSEIPLRTDHGSVRAEVDHCVAFETWHTRLLEEMQPDNPEYYQRAARVNAFGNAALLEKSYNASRGKDSLATFLAKVHEFQSGAVKISDWAVALRLTNEFIEPEKFSLDEVAAAIEARDVLMQQDLERFVKGEVNRKDI